MLEPHWKTQRISGAHATPRSSDSDDESGIAIEVARPKLKEPPKFAVVLHNDDYTTMEFVVEVLQRFFHRTGEEAAQIMLKIHHSGKGVAGVYSHEIAETKVAQVEDHARANGFPLKASVEEAGAS